MPTPPFETPLRVRYSETDQMGVVYHANLLPYFEVGRTELLRSIGPSYRELEKSGFLLAVVEAAFRYAVPIRYDDSLRIRTRITELGRASVAFEYEVADAEAGTVHAKGFTRHACLSPDGIVRPLPDDLHKRLAAAR